MNRWFATFELLTAALFASSAVAQSPKNTALGGRPMTLEQLHHVEDSPEYQSFRVNRSLTADFSRGVEYNYPDLGATVFLVPVTDRLPDKFVFFVEGGLLHQRGVFLAQFTPMDRTGKEFKFTISDTKNDNSMDLYYSSAKLAKVELHGEELNKPGVSSDTSAGVRALAAYSSFQIPTNIWGFFYCIWVNGVWPDVWYCSQCIFDLWYAAETGVVEASTQLYCQLCLQAMPNAFGLCWVMNGGH